MHNNLLATGWVQRAEPQRNGLGDSIAKQQRKASACDREAAMLTPPPGFSFNCVYARAAQAAPDSLDFYTKCSDTSINWCVDEQIH